MADWEDASALTKDQADKIAKAGSLVTGDQQWEDAPSQYSKFMRDQSVPRRTTLEGVGEGIADPAIAAAQIEAHVLPKPAMEGINWARGLLGRQPITTASVDKAVLDREARIQASRPIEYAPRTPQEQAAEEAGSHPVRTPMQPGVDTARLGGNLLATLPMAALGPGAGAGAGALARIGGSAAVGGLSASLNPVTQEDFWTQKAKQAGIGIAVGSVVPATALGVARGADGFSAYLSRNLPSSLKNAAVTKILDRFEADAGASGPTAQQALDLMNTARAAGKPLTLADLGGENIKGLAGNVARQPGQSRNLIAQFLSDRDQGAGSRIASDIDKGIATGSAHDTAQALMAARSSAAAPLYHEAFRANQNMSSTDIDRILMTPAGKKALAAARIKMQNDMTLMGVPDKELMEQAREAGQYVPGGRGVASGLKLRTLDYVKRSFDDQIGAAQRAGERDEARILVGLKSRFVNALDDADVTARAGPRSIKPQGGAYAQARSAYSGPSQSIEAMEEGGKILSRTKTPEAIKAEFAELPPNERQFYKLGAANALKAVVAQTGPAGDEARRIVGSQYARDRLRSLFDSEDAFNKFVDSVSLESRMFRTAFNTLGGSQTAARMAEDNSADLSAMLHGARGSAHLASGNYLAALRDLLRAKRDLGIRQNPALNEQIARLLFDPALTLNASPGQRLLSQFAGPATRNYLAQSAQGLRRAAPFLGVPSGVTANSLLAPQAPQQ